MFLGPHKMKMSHYFSVSDSPPNFEVSPMETWDFFDFLTTPPLFGPIPKFPAFSIGKLPLETFPNF